MKILMLSQSLVIKDYDLEEIEKIITKYRIVFYKEIDGLHLVGKKSELYEALYELSYLNPYAIELY